MWYVQVPGEGPVPFAIEPEPPPSDQAVIQAVHVDGLLEVPLRGLYYLQKHTAEARRWLQELLTP